MDYKMKTVSLLMAAILLLGMALAQNNFESTSSDNSNFGETSISSTTFKEQLSGAVSSLSFFEAPQEPVSPGQEVVFEFETDIAYENDAPYTDDGGSLAEEDKQFVVEVYDCGSVCGDDDEFIDGLRFDNFDLLTENISSGDSIKASTRYTIPERSDGPHSVTGYVWVEEFNSDGVDNDGDGVIDEEGEALVSDAPSAEFEVSGDAPEGSDRTISPDESITEFFFDNLFIVVLWILGLSLVLAYLISGRR